MNAPRTATDPAVKTSVAHSDQAIEQQPVRTGRTVIAPKVVATVAGIATREVPGVYATGDGATRAVGALREQVPGVKSAPSQGVAARVDDDRASVRIDLVADYGTAIADLAADVRRNVTSAVHAMTGLRCVPVDIVVHDVHLAPNSALA
ncbi:hypothetical protein ASG56_15595 [Rhodococcus sp. Leaf7]|uniref:Asp23/Gls24 family envelope stress response protein n=1 Tax=unclassified Rhodococcus (in: high G+C Gram-positive bacteria) TaxID=192944 RepID=UPI0006FDE087|nr:MULTISPECIES: Asp23/Gls24 family envelope stress response protein [unclassified Rhodococcus (in: high G+C Gram-positive bacteria)]KQU02413.1 hypothetical protein ASG56_15595 [Rhodococcus sp. Leaf7]KQU37884.1 hypothetical protein ASG64_18325 [Rhodococcus sp. Leaf247]